MDDPENQQTLAFAGAAQGLILASSRAPFPTDDLSAVLNVEVFNPEGDATWPMLLFIHGICESAETWAVQRLARTCAENKWRLFVLELEGHGLSSGGRAVCGDFDRLRSHVDQFVRRCAGAPGETAPFALCGSSLGGVLAAYGSDGVSRRSRLGGGLEDLSQRFIGASLFAPAVGVSPEAVPPLLIVYLLRILAFLAPSAGILTPVEDPYHYACPETSTRNFCGRWPLSTSRMLLDVTSDTIRADQESGELALEIPALLVFAATEDTVVPLESVQDFYSAARAVDKKLIEVPGADHGLMFEEGTAVFVLAKLFGWLNSRTESRRE